MGKKRRRLLRAKFAKKFAHLRAARARLEGVTEAVLADGVVTADEAALVEEAVAEVAEAAEAAGEATVEATTPFKNLVKKAEKKPAKKAAPKRTRKKKSDDA